ncbi:hypothetical protein DC522_03280 [Microvirga sp. KLBC 81]|nr:hypothetical protein DC522_03280 [Microvirga sp. KLBC 81]
MAALQAERAILICGPTPPSDNTSLPMPDQCSSYPSVRDDAAAMDDAALEEACLADELAVLAGILEGQGCPCAAYAFWQASRRHQVQSLLHTAQAAAARVV